MGSLAGVVEVVLPVFAMILLGFAAAKRQLVSEEGFKAMTLFVFGLAAPALLFAGGTRPHEGGGGAALALLSGSVVMFWLAVAFGRSLFRLNLGEASLFALSCIFGNSVMMGVPIIVAAYGPAGVPPMLGILAFTTMILLGQATVLTEVGLHANAPWRRVLGASLKGILRNPVVLAVVAAFLWTLLGLHLPDVARRTLEMMGAAAPPLALFCLGGGLAGIAGAALWQETAAIVVVKLLALPALVWGLALWLDLPPIEMAVAVTMAALPTGANAFILARRYATGTDRSGAAVVVTTALSVLTLSALIGHFRGILP
ncbi:AEC family transporter [Falsiroseomonas tokyonensis]|uniref:AEC family transporter n=1 Tax=Falsiroseomonas tokyonensis TaxID=430521 RepID=A0ABV7BNR5_9PROT|nr:AEC family transporter [Falsiroseomonas tokyonensis]MBU8536279.1 AEC family transporter [Falsiroseomonas tokyonensis]